jgi:hypothetical protein
MAKVHVVREPFSLDGKDYKRGDEIHDDAVLEKAKASHAAHLTPTLREPPSAQGE